MIKRFKLHAAAAGVAVALAVGAAPAQAARIQLGFVLDESGSIAASEWNIIRTGLASAINLIPVGGVDAYYLSVVTFDDNSNTRVTNTLVTAGNRATLANTIATMSQGAGFTNYEAGFRAMDTALGNSNEYDFSYVNFATDGEPNRCGTTTVTSPGLAGSQACAVAARNDLIASGVDNISIEGIGVTAANATWLQTAICSPLNPDCDTTVPFNFPSQGFYIGVANATQYAEAIQNKIRVITTQVPEPGTMALLSAGLLGFAFSRRRKV
jgi:hypothetical protein